MFRYFAAAILVLGVLGPRPAAAELPGIVVDEAKVKAAGIRRLPAARRLVLYTDLPASSEIERLPGLFDLAFPQWCEYFHVPPAEHNGWRIVGFLMKDKAPFREAGLLPDRLPPFSHGYSQGGNLWLYDQPSDYYRRHLLLHEGTHCFMNTILGGYGPPWYAEGTAELMGTHRLADGRLTLNIMPASREEVPEWGRIRIVKDAVAANRSMRLLAILDYSSTAHIETEPYGWCWALCALLDRHPRYQNRFRQLYKDVLRGDFNARFRRLFAHDWTELCDEWAVFVAGIEYGYDVPRAAIEFAPGRPFPAAGAGVQVAADRGWQPSGLRLEAGAEYRLAASGRYRVGPEPQPWWCEPGGVSIRYYQGRPLGILLAAVRPAEPSPQAPSAFLRPTVVGLGTTLRPEQSGTLYFRINHSAAELAGNSGKLEVRVGAVK
ncbi:MAG: hypothetical protein ABR915_01500 [Thermoguttaceae bacterium]|jgi:hypothetical protein